MPVRPRRARHGAAFEWTPRVALALTIGPDPLHGPPDAVLRRSWEGARSFLLASVENPATTWGFWAYETAVPDELRGDRPTLRPVGIARADNDLEARRRAWLRDHEEDEP